MAPSRVERTLQAWFEVLIEAELGGNRDTSGYWHMEYELVFGFYLHLYFDLVHRLARWLSRYVLHTQIRVGPTIQPLAQTMTPTQQNKVASMYKWPASTPIILLADFSLGISSHIEASSARGSALRRGQVFEVD